MKVKRIDIKGNLYDIEAFLNPIPAGTVLPFAGDTAPEGFLLCNGQEVSRFSYSKLYGVLGDTYGAGDGKTTFNLPNLVEKFIEGTESYVGQTLNAGLPNIKGEFYAYTYQSGGASGAFASSVENKNQSAPAAHVDRTYVKFSLDASKKSGIYGKSDTVQPPAIKMLYIIKY